MSFFQSIRRILSCQCYTLGLAGMLTVGSVVGCAGDSLTVKASPLISPRTPELVSLRDEFLRADTEKALVRIVAAADAFAAEHAITYELKGELAAVRGDSIEASKFFMSAVMRAPSNEVAHLIKRLNAMPLSYSQKRALLAYYRGVIADGNHASQTIFGEQLAHWARRFDDKTAIALASNTFGKTLRPWIIGPFDNDQGKGFDVPYPPESIGVVSETAKGSVIQVNWRQAPVVDPTGTVVLNRLVKPVAWQTAYAQSEFNLTQTQNCELRVSSSDPLKVWVDGTLVYQNRTMGAFTLDNVVVPLRLEEGRHRVLVKTMNQNGQWALRMRLTGEDNRALVGTLSEIDSLGEMRNPVGVPTVRKMEQKDGVSSLYEQYVRAYTAYRNGENKAAVEAAQALLAKQQSSIMFGLFFARVLVANKERGRASDVFNELEKRHGDSLALISIRLAEFWSGQKMNVKARELLHKRYARNSNRWHVASSLAANYQREGWYEEAAAVLERMDVRHPGILDIQLKLAAVYRQLKQYKKAAAIYEEMHRQNPGSYESLSALHWLAIGNDRFEEAVRWAQTLQRLWPEHVEHHQKIAEAFRRNEQYDDAIETLKELIRLQPGADEPWYSLARIYLRTGQKAAALESMQASLERDPDNRKLANRVAWMAPKADGPWRADVPTDAQIASVIKKREALSKGVIGANLLYLLDDEVTALQKDGSTYNIVTIIAHALNQEGRDEVTQMVMRGGGRSQVINAFAVNAAGQRIEASSIRGRSIRYRQLDVGSTVVLQYRIDSRPEPYLSGHIDRSFWFQARGIATAFGRWVIWVPKDEKVHFKKTQKVSFKDETRGKLRRLSWSAENVMPLITEPSMPPMVEVAESVSMSTVPSWAVVAEWEKALLVDAYRDSPAVKAVAADILADVGSAKQRIRKIHEYVIQNIRYQQDYEETIAGVKPHTAAQVLARQYGDCKDKAVLFIALAREVGLDVHFVSVRTRDRGPLLRDVPSQQFNHAIVYVPKQAGIEVGRFYDPTVDTLDLDVLRSDDQGTLAYVYDELKQTHYWKEIPFQNAAMDTFETGIEAELLADGQIRGSLSVGGRGDFSAWLRSRARNPTKFKQAFAQSLVNTVAPGGKVESVDLTEVTDLAKPVTVKVGFAGSGMVRQEGKEQRWKVPIRGTANTIQSVKDRKYPFLMGKPRTFRWALSLSLPKNAKVSRLPPSVDFSHSCLSYRRTYERQGARILINQVQTILCERLSADDVPAVQALVTKIRRSEQGEVVLRYER